MEAASRTELLEACRVLFGRTLDPAFLNHLQESGLRVAWRRRALQTHPDRVVDAAAKRRHTQRFIEARRAYGLLREYVVRRPPSTSPAAARTAQSGRTARTTAAGASPRSKPQRPRPQRATNHPAGDGRRAPGLPRRRLLFGEYLLHSRVIGFTALIEAILWQRRQRARFCEVVRRWGYLTDNEVETLLAVRRPFEQVGATAQRLQMLTSLQVRTVLWFQRSRQTPIGNYFVQQGLLSATALESLLLRFELHNTLFRRR